LKFEKEKKLIIKMADQLSTKGSTKGSTKDLTKAEIEFCKKRDELVLSLRAYHGKYFDENFNQHLHPCYKCLCPCTCKNKIAETLGPARASMGVEFW
jgi:hypothetical protein